jgi:hypothetical protein
MKFQGANEVPALVGLEELPGKSHYYIGQDPSAWRDVHQYARVGYRQVYPGIDLAFYGNQRELEYDLVVAPGADPRAVRLTFEGAEALRVDDDGNLAIQVGGGELRQLKPIVYQEVEGVRRAVAASYEVRPNGEVGFEVAAFDPREPLVIDPVLSYATYVGGTGVGVYPYSSGDDARGIAVDAFGNAYVVGTTTSVDFPIAGRPSTYHGNGDAFVLKLDPTGSNLLYSTFLGGSDKDQGIGIAVDRSGNAYVTGWTLSPDFPTTPLAFQTTYGGTQYRTDFPLGDAFVVKLNDAGSIVYATYLGGSDDDAAVAISVDSQGSAYVAGLTSSSGFPFDHDLCTAAHNYFVTKLNAAGSKLVYSTCFPGGIEALAVDAAGNAYLAGEASSDFPTVQPIQQYRGFGDAFVSKLDPSGAALVYSTFLGGTAGDRATAIAVDRSGNVFVTGSTTSPDFPTVNAIQPAIASTPPLPGGEFASDAFVAKIDATGSSLVYSTYLGGSDSDFATALAVDASGNAYVTGVSDTSTASDFPLVNAFRPPSAAGNCCVGDFVAKVNPSGSALVYSTGVMQGGLSSIAVDGSGSAYVAGTASVPGLATPGAFQTTIKGGTDAVVAKISEGAGNLILSQGFLVKDHMLPTGPDWTATKDVPWLTLSQYSGTGPSTVLAIVDTTSLPPGPHAGAIVVSAPGADNSPQSVAVNLTLSTVTIQSATANPGGPYVNPLDGPVPFDGSGSLDPLGSIAPTLGTSATAPLGPGSGRSTPTPTSASTPSSSR